MIPDIFFLCAATMISIYRDRPQEKQSTSTKDILVRGGRGNGPNALFIRLVAPRPNSRYRKRGQDPRRSFCSASPSGGISRKCADRPWGVPGGEGLPAGRVDHSTSGFRGHIVGIKQPRDASLQRPTADKRDQVHAGKKGENKVLFSVFV